MKRLVWRAAYLMGRIYADTGPLVRFPYFLGCGAYWTFYSRAAGFCEVQAWG